MHRATMSSALPRIASSENCVRQWSNLCSGVVTLMTGSLARLLAGWWLELLAVMDDVVRRVRTAV